MKSLTAVSLAVLALAASAGLIASPCYAGESPSARARKITPPPRPNPGVQLVVQPGVADEKGPRKAHGHLTRKGAGRGHSDNKPDRSDDD